MKPVRALGALAIGTAALLASNLGPSAAADVSFSGVWTSVDTDGSRQTLTVRGPGPHHSATYYDDVATQACGGAPATITGRATADANALVMAGNLRCGGGTAPLRHITVGFELQSDGTLLDQFGITWTRA